MSEAISRRRMLGMTAGAAGAAWVFALDGAGNVVRAAADSAEFAPAVLSPQQLDAVAKLCETIIPATDTPGAIDARVHEYVDVRLSGSHDGERRRFLRGLNWLEGYCSAEFDKPIDDLDEHERIALLQPLSDEHDAHPRERQAGADFFATLKNWTIHGYYTSREGRVQTLGLPESPTMEQWTGCTHAEH